MPLGLAQAYGAAGWPHNPHGRGHCADPDQADAVALPNVEHPQHPVLKPSDVPPLATLGPLPQGSPERSRWLGTLDESWQRRRLPWRSEEHTSELQSLMRISYAVFCLKKKNNKTQH